MQNEKVPEAYKEERLGNVAAIAFSSVDKKTTPGESRVRLCNYMDVYKNDYLSDDWDYMAASASTNEISRFALRSGDVLITKDSETPDDIGVSAVIDSVSGTLVCGYHLALIRPSADVNSLFLAKQFKHYPVRRYLAKEANGITRYGLTMASVRNMPLLLPSRAYQDCIAGILRTLDETIHQTEQFIAKLQRVNQGLLHDLLTRGVNENSNLRESTYDPAHFKAVRLGEVAPVRREGGRAGLPTMAVTMRDGLQPRDPEERRVETNLKAERHLQARQGDIAYNMMRMWQGACGLAHTDCLVSPAYVVVAPSGVVPAFLYLLFKQPETIHKFHVGSRGLTNDRLRLYYEDFARISVLLPRSLREQQAIVDRAHCLERRILAEQAYIEKLKQQKLGLMDDLLTGRVRVPIPAEATP